MLHHRLPAPERTGYRSHSALRYREKRVYYSLPRHHRHRGIQFVLIRTPLPYRPVLYHRYLLYPVRCLYLGYHSVYIILAVGYYLYYFPFNSVRYHYFMQYYDCFLYGTEFVACDHFVSFFSGHLKLPKLLVIKSLNFQPSSYPVPGCLAELIQRSLYPVKNPLYKPGPEFYGKRQPRRVYRRSHSEPVGFFVYLH